MIGGKRIIVEFLDGKQKVYDRPDDPAIGWWHGTSEFWPGVYTVMHTFDDRELLPIGNIRRIRTLR